MMKVKPLIWWLLGIGLAILGIYYFQAAPERFSARSPIVLNLNPISPTDFRLSAEFRWIHRHCQPVNPFDPENLEGGWLHSLEKASLNQFVLKFNPNVKWGSGEPVSLKMIQYSLGKNLLAGDEITATGESELTLTSERSTHEVTRWLQDTLIYKTETTLINSPKDLQCFGKFNRVEWAEGKVTLTADPNFKPAKLEPKASDSLKGNPADKSSVQDKKLEGTPVDQIQITFKSQPVKDALLSFISKELDYVGPIALGEVNPKSLLAKIKSVSKGDFFVFFAPLDSAGRSKTGEFMAKALNRGELLGLNYSGPSLLPNFHIISRTFTLSDQKPLFSSLPEFNFASVADARELLSHIKPPLSTLKISREASDVALTFLTFFKSRLRITYKINLEERILEEGKETIGNFKTDNLVLARLKSGDDYLADFLTLLTKLYPSFQSEFKRFDSALKGENLSPRQISEVIFELEKFLLERYLVIPVGDVSLNYLLSDQIRGEYSDLNLDLPLFFNSFRTE
jgi:hypothetical protein